MSPRWAFLGVGYHGVEGIGMSREGRSRWDIWWRKSSRFVIGRPGNPMLVRWRLIQTPLFGIYVHFIYREDLDRYPHDHPWSFWSFVLRGGYREEYHPDPHGDRTWHVVKQHLQYSLHHFPLKGAHRIVSVMPNTVTLVLVGRKQRSWGFFGPEGWVDYRDALNLRPVEGVV